MEKYDFALQRLFADQSLSFFNGWVIQESVEPMVAKHEKDSLVLEGQPVQEAPEGFVVDQPSDVISEDEIRGNYRYLEDRSLLTDLQMQIRHDLELHLGREGWEHATKTLLSSRFRQLELASGISSHNGRCGGSQFRAVSLRCMSTVVGCGNFEAGMAHN